MSGEIIEAVEVAPGRWETDVAPGLYPDLTNAEYHKGPGVSKSMLDVIAEPNCPLDFYDKYVDPNPPEEKPKEDWQVLGDAIHKAILEPDLLSQFAYVPDDAPQRPTDAMKKSKNPSVSSQDRVSWWADFEREHEGKTILPSTMAKALIGARDAVHMHPVAKHLFTGGNAEQSYYARDPETGLLIKCRPDYELLEREGMIVDLKTTESAAERAFRQSVISYRYDVQDPWYQHVIHRAFDQPDGAIVRKFVFVAVEKVRPFCTGIYWITKEDRQRGIELARADLALIQECRRTNLWPDYGCNPKQLRIARRSYSE